MGLRQNTSPSRRKQPTTKTQHSSTTNPKSRTTGHSLNTVDITPTAMATTDNELPPATTITEMATINTTLATRSPTTVKSCLTKVTTTCTTYSMAPSLIT